MLSAQSRFYLEKLWILILVTLVCTSVFSSVQFHFSSGQFTSVFTLVLIKSVKQEMCFLPKNRHKGLINMGVPMVILSRQDAQEFHAGRYRQPAEISDRQPAARTCMRIPVCASVQVQCMVQSAVYAPWSGHRTSVYGVCIRTRLGRLLLYCTQRKPFQQSM